MDTDYEMFYFLFSDGKKSELMNEATAKIFKRHLNRAGMEFEIESVYLMKDLNDSKGILDALAKENFELKKQVECLISENRVFNNKLESLQKKVDNHIDIRTEYCPHTER